MCVFKNISNKYERILNIEFKHKNTVDKNIAKDILKLLREKQNGAFIHLLNNTRKGAHKGTLCNVNKTGVFDKFYKSFSDFKANWTNDRKSIQLIIISLNQKMLIYRKISKPDLNNLKEIFFIGKDCGNMTEIKGNGWHC